MSIILQKADLAGTDFANNNSNAAGGVTIKTGAGSAVGTAIAAAISAYVPPADKFLAANPFVSYTAATDTLVLSMSDGSTVAVPLTTLISDAVATAKADATVILYANDGTTVIGHLFA